MIDFLHSRDANHGFHGSLKSRAGSDSTQGVGIALFERGGTTFAPSWGFCHRLEGGIASLTFCMRFAKPRVANEMSETYSSSSEPPWPSRHGAEMLIADSASWSYR